MNGFLVLGESCGSSCPLRLFSSKGKALQYAKRLTWEEIIAELSEYTRTPVRFLTERAKESFGFVGVSIVEFRNGLIIPVHLTAEQKKELSERMKGFPILNRVVRHWDASGSEVRESK